MELIAGTFAKLKRYWTNKQPHENPIATLLFNAGLLCYVSASCIALASYAKNPAIDSFVSFLKWISLGFLAIKMIYLLLSGRISLDKKSWYLVFMLGCLFVSFAAFITSGQKDLFLSVAVMIGAYGEDYRDIAKKTFIVALLAMGAIVLPAIIGLTEFNVMARTTADTGERIFRYAFGFSHVNALGSLAVLEFLLFLVLRWECFKLSDYAVWVIVALFLYYVVKTRTAPLILIAGCSFVLLLGKRASKYLVQGILSAIFIISGIILVAAYSDHSLFLNAVNKVLSGRLSYASYFLLEYGVTPIGQSIDFVSTVEAVKSGRAARVLDDAYIRLLVNYGVISLLSVIGIYVQGFLKTIKLDLFGVALAITLIALIAMSEIWAFSFVGSIVMMIICAINTAQRHPDSAEEH